MIQVGCRSVGIQTPQYQKNTHTTYYKLPHVRISPHNKVKGCKLAPDYITTMENVKFFIESFGNHRGRVVSPAKIELSGEWVDEWMGPLIYPSTSLNLGIFLTDIARPTWLLMMRDKN
jgi:hypothetical protein